MKESEIDALPSSYLPMLTFFYGGTLTRQRVNNEADRLTAFARVQVGKGKATEEEFEVWRSGRELWREHWLLECAE